MDFKDFLVSYLAKVKLQNQKRDNTTSGITRTEAIEYLKSNGYELTEENVQTAFKAISNQNNENVRLTDVMNMLNKKKIDDLVNDFNLELFRILRINRSGVNPNNLIWVNDGECVLQSYFTFLNVDLTGYENVSEVEKDILKIGIIGRLYITNRRVIINYLASSVPIVSTLCADLTEISSYGISGFNDELFFVLKSGQRITVNMGNNLAVDYLNEISKVIDLQTR